MRPLFDDAGGTGPVWAGPQIVREADWPGVRPRLTELAGRAGAGRILGATSHRWELEPPLTAGELAEAEVQIGVELPVEYRSFLLEVGRGGAGPAYGLFPLRRVDGRWVWDDGDDGSLRSPESLRLPFAHIRGFNPLDDLPEQLRPGHDPAPWNGLLHLCHHGCALWDVLVVSGPSRGEMWTDRMADAEGFQPLQNPDGSRMTFADWYLTWLAAAEREAAGT